VTRGHLGHSRKIDLRTLLAMVRGQAASALIEQAMDAFGVGARSVEQTLSDLEWGGYIERRPVELDRPSRVLVLTEKGRRALADSVLAADLISLPKMHRTYRAALRDCGHPDHVRAMLDEWRRGMRRDGAGCESPSRLGVRPEPRLRQSGVSATGIYEIFGGMGES
jgi:DNA-binding MarR family transcriptional regulator